MTLVSANIRFVPIFEGVCKLERGRNRKHGFQGFRRYVFSTLRNETNVIMYYLIPFHWSRNIWPCLTLNGLNVHYTLQYCGLRSCLPSVIS